MSLPRAHLLALGAQVMHASSLARQQTTPSPRLAPTSMRRPTNRLPACLPGTRRSGSTRTAADKHRPTIAASADVARRVGRAGSAQSAGACVRACVPPQHIRYACYHTLHQAASRRAARKRAFCRSAPAQPGCSERSAMRVRNKVGEWWMRRRTRAACGAPSNKNTELHTQNNSSSGYRHGSGGSTVWSGAAHSGREQGLARVGRGRGRERGCEWESDGRAMMGERGEAGAGRDRAAPRPDGQLKLNSPLRRHARVRMLMPCSRAAQPHRTFRGQTRSAARQSRTVGGQSTEGSANESARSQPGTQAWKTSRCTEPRVRVPGAGCT